MEKQEKKKQGKLNNEANNKQSGHKGEIRLERI